jgi:hypothetical protein
LKRKRSKRPQRSPGRESGLCRRGTTSETGLRMFRCAAFAINGSNQAIGIARSTASHRHESRITAQTSNTCDTQTALRLVARTAPN